MEITKPGLYLIHQSKLASTVINVEDMTIVQMSCGSEHSALVCESGRVFTFGGNAYGQLGLSEKSVSVSLPTLVSSLTSTPIRQVSCGESFTLFLSSRGEVFTCGSNTFGQLGHGSSQSCSLPIKITKIPPVNSVAAGGFHAALLTTTGEVWVTGSNTYGQLGLGNKNNRSTFCLVPDVRAPVVSVSCGYHHTALVTSCGDIFTAGRSCGQIGHNYTINLTTFRPPVLPLAVTSVDCGGNHTVALAADGSVWAWGENGYGQLGIGTDVARSCPKKMVGVDNHIITKIVAGHCNTALHTGGGHVLLCGAFHTGLGGVESINVSTMIPKPPHLTIDMVASASTYNLILVNKKPEHQSPTKYHLKHLPCDDAILKALECPICLTVMSAPIYQCSVGHSVCSTCRALTNKCSVCRKPYIKTRNLGLESVSDGVHLSCEDCGDGLSTNLLEDHEVRVLTESMTDLFPPLEGEEIVWRSCWTS